jgi:preprotein translocase subunit YajC
MFAMRDLLQQGGSNPGLTFLVVSILVIVLSVVIWFLINRGRKQPPGQERAQNAALQEKTRPDDLTRIEGIGPKVAKVLNNTGIRTFAELARADSTEVKRELNEAGLQMMNPEGWIEQASLAARGDWEGLEKLQRELNGGRRS